MLEYARKRKPAVTHAATPPKRLRSSELGEQVNVRLQPALLAKVDALRTVGVSRADVIRDLITKA
jgi:hypothetical protein